MKLKSLIIIIYMVGVVVCAHAQSFTLQGRVTDEQLSPIELASVQVVKQGKATLTSLKGEFSMELQSADSVEVKFSMIGYKTRTRVLRNPKGKQTLQIILQEDDQMLSEVNVTEMKRQTTQTQELRKEDMKNTPSTTGNAVEEMIQSQAGVSTHNELSSQYNVRGGSFDENSVYINNIEVFRPFLVRSGQQEGLSVINPDMVERIGFSTGGFAAKYGDKMSSTLDIGYKRLEPQGQRKSVVEGSVSASLLGAGAYLGIGTKKLSWLNSVRYKTTRFLLSSQRDVDAEYDPTFLDYQTYLSYKPNKRWTIDFIGNISDNHYNFTPHNRTTDYGTQQNVMSFMVYFDGWEKDLFRTYFGNLSITRHFTANTHLSLLASAYTTREQERFDIQSQYWLTQADGAESLGVGTFFEHSRNYLNATVKSVKLMMQHKTRHHDVEGAVTLKHEYVKERSVEYEMRDSAGYSVPHTGQDLYMIYSLKAQNELRDTSTVNGITYATLNKRIKSQRSIHFIAGYDHTFRMANRKFKFTAEAYYKMLSQLVPYRVNNVKVVYYGENEASGHAAGLDLKLYGEFVEGTDSWLSLSLMTDSWLSLSLMDAKMKLNGKSVPLPTDQRIALSLFFTDYFPGTQRWKLSLKLAYADGLPFSPPHRELETNLFRAKAYRRADVGMSYLLLGPQHGKPSIKHPRVWLGVDCFNLLGIDNVNSYYWITSIANQQFAVPNYLTGRQLNARVLVEF